MKILFLHVYSEKNTGDAAIVSVMLQQYREKYPGVEIVLSSITQQKNRTFEDALYITSIFQEAIYTSVRSSTRIFNTIGIVLNILFQGMVYKRTGRFIPFLLSQKLQIFVREVQEASIILGVGGGYIIARKNLHDTVSLILTLLEIWFCKQLGKYIVLEAMSVGPVESAFQRRITKKVLNEVAEIHVRENISYKLLKELEITKPKIQKSVDLGFYFFPKTKVKMRNYLMKRGVFFTKPVLGVTVKQCFPLGDMRQRMYEEAIAGFVNEITAERDLKVVFIPHVTAKAQNDDDRDVIQRIKPLLTAKEKVILLMEEYNYQDIKGIYENMTWLVGTRMHSVIFAYTSKVPVIAIAYEPKTKGVLATLGLQKYVIDADVVTSSVLQTTFSLL